MSRKQICPLLFFLLAAFAFVYVYVAFYWPAVQETEQKKQRLQVEKKMILALEEQKQKFSGTPSLVTGSLQMKVPIKPMTDKLLLDFEKAGILSDSLIKTIVFTKKYEEPDEEKPASPLELRLKAGDLSWGKMEHQQKQGKEMISQIAERSVEEKLPAGIREMEARLTVQSPGYEEMEIFIQALEEQLRMMKIEQLELTGPIENQKMADENNPLTYTVSIAVYYMPELPDLLQSAQEVKAPIPVSADKQDQDEDKIAGKAGGL